MHKVGKLTLERRLSGCRAVRDQAGTMLGTFDLKDLELNDPEFEDVVRDYAESKRSAASADELIRQARAYAARAATVPTDAGSRASEGGGSKGLSDVQAAELSSNSNSDEFAAKIKARAKEKGIPYGAAYKQIAREEPELVQAARAEALGQRATKPKKNFDLLMAKAAARAAQKRLNIGQAAEEIRAEEPELAAAADAERGLQPLERKKLTNGVEMVICRMAELDPSGFLAYMAGNRLRHKGISYRLALSEVSQAYPSLAQAARAAVMGVKPDSLTSGTASDSASYLLADLAKKRCVEKNISIRAALSEIAREYPDIARRADDEVMGRNPS